MRNVLIIGAGALGQAIGKVLPRDRAQVFFFDLDPSKCPEGQCAQLEAAVPVAEFIFLCVPSWGMRQAVGQVAALIKPGAAVISMAKGLESPTAKTMDQVCTELLPPNQPVAVLGGALLAYEMAAGLPAMGVIGCTSDEVAANLLALFQGSPIQLTWSSDARSIAFAGVLKNVYALMLGIGDGLGLGSNARGWLFAQSIVEMQDIAQLLRIDPRTLLSVAGVGDLVATGLSPQSKNHSAGVELAQTGHTQIPCEGIQTFPSLMQLLGERPNLRILGALNAILQQGQNVRVVVQNLVYRKT